ncbi:MAG: cadherin-like beta sandwich domain-containing protein, partial [Verrucomicrobiales bacterium]
MKRFAILHSLLLLALLPAARAQTAGQLDAGFDPGTGANSSVRSVAVQADGKVLIGGEFTSFDGVARNRIARLNADGSLDAGFDPGDGAGGSVVLAVAVQADGKVLVGGEFTSFDGVARNRIARLNADGSLDAGFDPGDGAGGTVRAVAVQADGKVLVGGVIGIVRLNADGSLDTGFAPGDGPGGQVHAVAVQADGKVLIGGAFTHFDGTSRFRIARLNSDGSLDTDFVPDPGVGSGAETTVYSVAVQADGKILVGGWFTSYDGVPSNRIARLNVDGSLDTGFDPGDGASSAVYSVAVQADDKVLVGGQFTSFDGVARNRIARLNADGSLDAGFDPGDGAGGTVRAVAVQADGKVLVGGQFSTFDGVPSGGIARLFGESVESNADLSSLTLSSGTLAPAFASGTTDYSAAVGNATASLTVTPNAADPDATIAVRVNGGSYLPVASGSASAALALNVGANLVEVRVTAEDGATERVYSVEVFRRTYAPAAPQLFDPEGGTSLIQSPGGVKLSWAPEERANWHEVYLSRNGSLYLRQWVTGEPEIDGEGKAVFRFNTAELPPGDYKWWVRSYAPVTGSGSWSTAGSFRVECEPLNPPSMPGGQTEFEGHWPLALEIEGFETSATWAQFEVLQGGASFKQLWVSITERGQAASYDPETGAGDSAFTILPDGDYHWKARIWSACHGNSAWSAA